MRIAGLIIAGGKSSRMGQNKALIHFKQKPLIEHVYDRLKYQVEKVYININQACNNFKYKENIIPDKKQNYQGPLAGLDAALQMIQTEWLQIAPCDTPFLPLDLTQILMNKSKQSLHKIIIPQTQNNIHPTLGLFHSSIADDLNLFLKNKDRGFINFINSVGFEGVSFENEHAFVNINTPEELEKYEKNENK
ncbi:MAG: molybdenum cofactor guanylyltransferase [Proteobacteria bacterium]|nr:molybdenum cofactor guanylyltransferase [Pseudomonadota bacterium]MDA1034970.1 molybdenum cofactor guanylyltransferase [Pseudomonadota bacterium]